MKNGVNIAFVPWTNIISLRFEHCIGKVLGLQVRMYLQN